MSTPETDAFVRDHYSQPDPTDCLDLASRFERERDEARGQRDRLVAVLQSIRDDYGGQVADPDCQCADCEFLIPIDEALQSLTPNEP